MHKKKIPGFESVERILVVGLGITGLSVIRFLSNYGYQLAIADSREKPPGLETVREEFSDLALFLGSFQKPVFENADLIVVSPGVPTSIPEIQKAEKLGIPVIGDIELFVRVANVPIVAITGSNGKSTVTTLIGEVAEANGLYVGIGGNLGKPALELLDEKVQLYILELSSFQLETTFSLEPHIAVVLNISPDHMDRYENIDHYAGVKAGIYERAEWGIYNLDDDYVCNMPKTERHMGFSLRDVSDPGVFSYQHDSEWFIYEGNQVMSANTLRIQGKHNYANVLAVLAMVKILELDLDLSLKVIGEFAGLPHRTEFVAEIDQVTWINDSKATNVGSCIASLQGLSCKGEGKIVLIAGGECKDANFDSLIPVVSQCARSVVLIGRDAEYLESLLKPYVPVVRSTDMEQAVNDAAKLALPGDQVLLAPACASFDMFKNYEHRGAVFAANVRGLAA